MVKLNEPDVSAHTVWECIVLHPAVNAAVFFCSLTPVYMSLKHFSDVHCKFIQLLLVLLVLLVLLEKIPA